MNQPSSHSTSLSHTAFSCPFLKRSQGSTLHFNRPSAASQRQSTQWCKSTGQRQGIHTTQTCDLLLTAGREERWRSRVGKQQHASREPREMRRGPLVCSVPCQGMPHSHPRMAGTKDEDLPGVGQASCWEDSHVSRHTGPGAHPNHSLVSGPQNGPTPRRCQHGSPFGSPSHVGARLSFPLTTASAASETLFCSPAASLAGASPLSPVVGVLLRAEARAGWCLG